MKKSIWRLLMWVYFAFMAGVITTEIGTVIGKPDDVLTRGGAAWVLFVFLMILFLGFQAGKEAQREF